MYLCAGGAVVPTDTGREWQMPAYIKPGATLRLFWGEGNPNNQTIHIRAIVDDEYVVSRFWSHSKGWRYQIEWGYWFWMIDKDGRVTVVKRGKDESKEENE